MALNTKIIGGLAWAGLVAVVAVPSADIVSAQLSPKAPLQMTADTDQIQTASIGDPVDAYVKSGKPLPSYLSDAPAPATTVAAPRPTVKILPPSGTPTLAPVPVQPMPGLATPAATDVAALPPMPYPASMRPQAPVVTEPVVVVEGQDVAALPTVDEPPVRRPPTAVEPGYVTEEDLADWDSGSLADYLESRNLIADAVYEESSSAEYDSDGFFLDDGPNNREIRSRSRNRRDFDEGYFLVFPD